MEQPILGRIEQLTYSPAGDNFVKQQNQGKKMDPTTNCFFVNYDLAKKQYKTKEKIIADIIQMLNGLSYDDASDIIYKVTKKVSNSLKVVLSESEQGLFCKSPDTRQQEH